MHFLIHTYSSAPHIPGNFELAHPNIYTNYDLLEYMKGTSPVEPQPQDLHDLEQHQHIQEEFYKGPTLMV